MCDCERSPSPWELQCPIWKMGTVTIAHSWARRHSMRSVETFKDPRYTRYYYYQVLVYLLIRDLLREISDTTFEFPVQPLSSCHSQPYRLFMAYYASLGLFALQLSLLGPHPTWLILFPSAPPDWYTVPLTVHTQSHSCTFTDTSSSA